jgi:hypothetical protein
MKKNMLKIFFGLTAFVAVCFSCASKQEGVSTMDGATLVAKNSGREKDKILIIDVRPEAEYKAGHIENAINMLSDTIGDNVSAIEAWKNMPIVVYCNTGRRSAAAADVLLKKGFKEVYNADGVKQYAYNLVTYSDILPTDLLKMKQDENTVLVDYRPQAQYEAGHIEGAINIELGEIKNNLDKLPKEKNIVLYCNTGTKSMEGAKELSALGYENVFNCIFGVKEYAYDLVK